jgi:hypothetical protein
MWRSSSNRPHASGCRTYLRAHAFLPACLLACLLANTRTRVLTQARVARRRGARHRRTRPRRQHSCAPRGGGVCSCLDCGI